MNQAHKIEDRPHGDWIVNRPKKRTTCSICKVTITSGIWLDVVKTFSFCPYCGAVMRGERNGRD